MSASTVNTTIINTNNKTFTLQNTGSTQFRWSDSLPYYLPNVLVVLLLVGSYVGNNWLSLWFAFALVPIIDFYIPADASNPTEEDRKKFENSMHFRLPLYSWVVMETLSLVFGAMVFSGSHIDLLRKIVTWFGFGVHEQSFRLLSFGESIGLLIGMGLISGGIGITVAHELFHKLNNFERSLGHILMAMANYQHFVIEHLSGHHKKVATPEDPATSRKGETVYSFYLRSLTGSYKSACEIEAERLNKEGKSFWSVHNQMIWFAVCPLLIATFLALITNWKAIVFFYIQGWIGHFLLEVVNYLEHYGLQRKLISPGVYERVDVTHSWNSPQRITNYFLFKLQRHSDHHANALRRYHVLRSFDESPQLPTGYAGMLVLALCPMLWFFVMDPLVEQYHRSGVNELQKQKDACVDGDNNTTSTVGDANDHDNKKKTITSKQKLVVIECFTWFMFVVVTVIILFLK